MVEWDTLSLSLEKVEKMTLKANPSLGGTMRNYFKEWLRTNNNQIIFGGPFLYFFHNYKLLFSHVYPLYVVINGLKFIWDFKKLYSIFLIKMAL
jgi:hypothetical protein